MTTHTVFRFTELPLPSDDVVSVVQLVALHHRGLMLSGDQFSAVSSEFGSEKRNTIRKMKGPWIRFGDSFLGARGTKA